MLIILLYLAVTWLLLTVCGYGISCTFFPKKQYRLWLSPWIGVVGIIFIGVFLGLAGLTVNHWARSVSLLLFLFSLYQWRRQKQTLSFSVFRKNVPVLLLIVVISIFNLSPLFLKYHFPTTLSMGNNDAEAYAFVPDYLKNHSLHDCLTRPVPDPVRILIPFGYRWGPSILTSFFLSLYNLQGYEFITIFQAVLYSLALPLLLILWSRLFPKTWIGGIPTLILVALNVNLLYFLYHNFFSQTIFFGLNLLIIILLLDHNPGPSRIFAYDRIEAAIAITVAVLFFSYSEAVLFILMPMALALLFRLFARSRIKPYILAYARIIALTFGLASFSIIHAFRFMTGYRAKDFLNPIGWQPFRDRLPFPNPFEALGFWSIHSFPPLAWPLAAGVSVVVLWFILKGTQISKHKSIILGFLSTYLFFMTVFAFWKTNFWIYNRAVAYSIPLITLFFTGGLVAACSRKKAIIVVSLILAAISAFHALSLNHKYLAVHLAVDKPLIGLQNLMPIVPGNKVFSQNIIRPAQPVWDELWEEYFLEPETSLVTSLESQHNNLKIQDNDFVLISKLDRYTPSLRIMLTEKVWDGRNFVIGRLCQSDECLQNHLADAPGLIVGQTPEEDSLLSFGWEPREGDSRWVSSASAGLRLINHQPATRIRFTVRTLSSPQEIQISIDKLLLYPQSISADWDTYNLPLGDKLEPGLHHVRFNFSHLYRPSQVMPSADHRILSAQFREIWLE